MGLAAAARGSDKWPQMPAFCAVPPAHEGRKKNVPTDETGGGKLTRRKHSFRLGSLDDHIGAQPRRRGSVQPVARALSTISREGGTKLASS
jgi:hypothetical protein